jgi:RHS repeat-associated protein
MKGGRNQTCNAEGGTQWCDERIGTSNASAMMAGSVTLHAYDDQFRKFTGKERDSETGLDFFGARYFSGAQGRFSGPDEPLNDQFPNDPQSWNLYSYVRNNPLKYTDPTGEDCVYTSNQTESSVGVALERGNCTQNGGTFVNGTIDENSFKYNGSSLDFGYTDPNGAVGTFSKAFAAPLSYGDQFINEMARRRDASNQFIGEFAKQAALGAAGAVAGRVIGAGIEALLAARAAGAAAAAVDVASLSNKIVRQMASRGWTGPQEILETVQNGEAYSVVNKATGGAATEYVNPATGKFVVVDNATKQVIQVSGPGFRPNHLVP